MVLKDEAIGAWLHQLSDEDIVGTWMKQLDEEDAMITVEDLQSNWDIVHLPFGDKWLDKVELCEDMYAAEVVRETKTNVHAIYQQDDWG